MKLAACTILYNPELFVLSNIRSYTKEVDFLILVDNSDSPSLLNFKELGYENYEYVWNNGNIGIASALNIAAKKAFDNGYEWLLTMDQDSKFEPGALEILKKGLVDLNVDKRVAIVSPNHVVDPEAQKSSNKYEAVLFAMTSGNIMNIHALFEVGGFADKLFIDYVDQEICLRLTLNKYKIFVVNHSYLIHALGNFRYVHFLGKRFGYVDQAPIRIYYMARNKYYVIFKYFFNFPKICLYFFYRIIFDMVKLTFFGSNKRKSLIFFIRGCWDLLLGKFGKYQS